MHMTLRQFAFMADEVDMVPRIDLAMFMMG